MRQIALLLQIHFLQSWRAGNPQGFARALEWALMALLAGFGWIVLPYLASQTIGEDGLPPEIAATLVQFGMAAYFMYAFLSPFFGSLSEDYSTVDKAGLLPLHAWQLYTVLIVAALCSPPLLFFLPALFSILHSISPDALRTLIHCGIFLVFLVQVAQVRQLVILLFLNMLKGRRFQDLLRILLPLVGIGLFIALQVLIQGDVSSLLHRLGSHQLPAWVSWTPPFWHSTLITGESLAVIETFLLVLLLAAFTGFLGSVGISLLDRVLHGELQSTGPAGKKNLTWEISGERKATSPGRRVGPIWGMFSKELLVMKREPAVKTLLLQQSFLFLLPFGMLLIRSGSDVGRILSGGAEIILPSLLILLYVEFQVAYFSLGFEGKALSHLLSTPIRPVSFLIGKNLAFGCVAMIWNVLILIVAAFLFMVPEKLVFLLPLNFSVLLVLFGWANLSSLIFPFPVQSSGRRPVSGARQDKRGCLLGLWSYVNLIVFGLLSLPLYFLLRETEMEDSLSVLGFLMAMLYSMAVYFVLLLLSCRLFRKRQYWMLDLFGQAGH